MLSFGCFLGWWGEEEVAGFVSYCDSEQQVVR